MITTCVVYVSPPPNSVMARVRRILFDSVGLL